MPFVKLDCGILNSTLWIDREAREIFITALLMAEPYELLEPTPQLQVNSLDETGWIVPAGWYGFVPAAGIGIIIRARVDETSGREALDRLGSPELSSRSRAFDGRRLVRINGGYIVLNFMTYRERDYTAAERSRRYRARLLSRRDDAPSHRNITQAEEEAEVEGEAKRERTKSDALRARFDRFWAYYPRKVGKDAAWKAWQKVKPDDELVNVMLGTLAWQKQQDRWLEESGRFVPNPATWLNQGRWTDEPMPETKRPTTKAEREKAEYDRLTANGPSVRPTI